MLAQHESFLFFPQSEPSVSRLWVDKRFGEDTAGRGDLSWSKDYSVIYDVVLSNKNWDRGRR